MFVCRFNPNNPDYILEKQTKFDFYKSTLVAFVCPPDRTELRDNMGENTEVYLPLCYVCVQNQN